MNMATIEEEIEEKGFCIVRDIVSASEVTELQEQLDCAMVEDWEEYQGLPGKLDWIVYDMVSKGGASLRLLENEIMQRIFSHFLGDTCILYSYTSTIIRPDTKQSTGQIHVDAPRIIPSYHSGMLMTLALDDFTEENGATYYLPSSQNRETRPTEEEFYSNAVRVCRNAGDAVFFNPRVWHAGGVNHTDKVRRGVTPYAVRSFMRQRFDYPRIVNSSITENLGERGMAFLGFNVRVPTSMREYYVDEKDRLYKGNQG